MITVSEAQQIIKTNISTTKTTIIPVSDALGYCLASNIIAPVAIPLFNQSAMDGYAFKFEDVNLQLQIIGEIPAGESKNITLNKGDAVRIFTGSKTPGSCDTVVMQELTAIIDGKLIVNDKELKKGGNIRIKGNQIAKGNLALKKGTKITPATIGFLSTLGLVNIEVFQQPTITIIATGNELIKPGETLKEGQIFESNTLMLKAALQQKGLSAQIIVIDDNQKKTALAISKVLNSNQLLIVSGGISVGDYDFVKESLEENNVKELFYKVKQKPGKPLYFGKTDSCYVFALPGNPAAALSCFYEYVSPSINIMVGNKQTNTPQLNLPLSIGYNKKEGRANFLKGYTDFNSVTPLEGQGSDALQSFSEANCLIYTSENSTSLKKGELVEVHLLPQ